MEWTAQKKQKLKRAVFIISFLIVPTVNFLLFYVYVNLNSILLAFQKNVNGETYWTFDTMRSLFGRLFPMDDEMREIFTNTFSTFGINLCLFLVGVFVSYFLYKKIFLYQAFRVLFYLPSILSAVVMCAVYQQLLSVNGEIAQWVQKIMNLEYPPEFLADSRFANAAVWINMIWLTFPGNLIIWGGTFARVPEGVIESARLDGVNWIQEAFRIIIPIVWPTFALMFVLQLAGIFGATGQVFLLTQGEWGTQTISSWMYIQVYATSLDRTSNLFNQMSALGLVLTLISCVITLIVRNVAGRAFKGVEY